MKKSQLVAVIVAVIAVLGFVAWYVSHNGGQVANRNSQGGAAANPQAALSPQSGLGAQVYNQVGKNPVQGGIPDANPLSAGTNPYSNAYKNPFAQ